MQNRLLCNFKNLEAAQGQMYWYLYMLYMHKYVGLYAKVCQK